MSEGPTFEADVPYKAERLAEIARMAHLLTERLLDNQIMARPVSRDGILALLKASLLLKDYGQAIPPLLNQIVQDLGDEEASGSAVERDDPDPDGAEQLAWALRPFQGLKGQ